MDPHNVFALVIIMQARNVCRCLWAFDFDAKDGKKTKLFFLKFNRIIDLPFTNCEFQLERN